MINSTFELEEKLIARGYEIIIGIDEVGRGPLAGPVVACAVAYKCHAELVSASKETEILKQVQDDKGKVQDDKGKVQDDKGKVQDDKTKDQDDKLLDLIRDSKMLSEKQRESLFDFIADNFHVGVGICDHRTIDRVNILEASFLAMKSAVSQLKKKIQDFDNSKMIILLDGNKKIPNFSFEQRAIVGGDKLIKSISAASIYAKVTRDRMMGEMHEKYPEYNFASHKGYGTKIHMDALKKHGPCEIHRKSFRPVRKCMV